MPQQHALFEALLKAEGRDAEDVLGVDPTIAQKERLAAIQEAELLGRLGRRVGKCKTTFLRKWAAMTYLCQPASQVVR